MKKTIFGFIGIACVGGFAAANGDSLLKPVSFPTTAADASFIERINISYDGYLPYESEYDSSGACISNCAYMGITLDDAIKDINIAEQQAQSALQEYSNSDEEVAEYGGVLDEYFDEQVQDIQLENMATHGTSASGAIRTCTDFIDTVPSDQIVPLGDPFPVLYRISSSFSPRRLNPVTHTYLPHNGTDLAAPQGTKVYTVASGKVVASWFDRTCGNGVKIVHDDKRYQTAYCHLSKRLVNVGDTVSAGCVIGRVGSTGRSTGPHLHYIVYFWSNGKYVPINAEKGYLTPGR